ncbi:MAG TPA: NADH-quinone oxidoreductase subunit C [Propionibacteriaceae bacterium]|nr:NADH-quinone oxidoreductase subunit C [Propionibacteriaceae bacterium]
MIEVAAENWLAAAEALKADGFDYFDWLGCVDEIGRTDCLRVVLVLRNLSQGAEPRMLSCSLPRDDAQIATVRRVFAGAAWHEREAAELFGIEFVGGERRRLLLNPEFEGTPLRKDEVLAARTGMNWPGAKEPGEREVTPGRRRLVPPGVPDPAVWGDRDAAQPAPDPAEVAESAVAGRVRRRRT